MKNIKKQKFNRYEARDGWKAEARDHVKNLLGSITSLSGLSGLSDENIEGIKSLVREFNQDLDLSIEQFNITPEIIAAEDCCIENLLDAITLNKIVISESNVDIMREIITQEANCIFVKCPNGNDLEKIRDFIEAEVYPGVNDQQAYLFA
jgi:hypothetical protein